MYAKNMIEMKDIYSSSVCEYTLDEAPQTYKDSKKVEESIETTTNIVCS